MTRVGSRQMFVIGAAALTLGLALPGAASSAACVLPTPPTRDVAKPAAPARPLCGELCSNAEIRAFNLQVQKYNEASQAYNRALQAYAERLNTFVAASAQYAKCEIEDVQKDSSDSEPSGSTHR